MNNLAKIGLSIFIFVFSSTLLAKTQFSPYADITINTHWSSEYQDMVPMDLDLIGVNNHIKGYHLAFITDSGICQPAWGSQSAYSVASQWGKHLTDSLASQGIETTVSFGGASGNDLSLNCDKNALLAILKDTVTTYQAKHLDFDVENGTANVSKLISVLQRFQQQHPNITLSFTLPVMPEGLTYEGKSMIEQARKANLDFNVNIMAMDYGPSYTDDMGKYAIQAATSLHDYLQSLYPHLSDTELWQKIEITPMIGVNDVNIEQFTLDNARVLKDFAETHHIGGLSMWSIARDKPCSEKWASPVCSGNGLQQKNYDFVNAMNL